MAEGSADTQSRNPLWKARYNACYAATGLRPGARGITTDVCVRISHLAKAVLGAKVDIAASRLIAPIAG